MPSERVLELSERLKAHIADKNELDERADYSGTKGRPTTEPDKKKEAEPVITFDGKEVAPLIQGGLNVFFRRHNPPLTEVTEKEALECGKGIAPLLEKVMPTVAEKGPELLAIGALVKILGPRMAEAQMYARHRREAEEEGKTDIPEGDGPETDESGQPFTFGPGEDFEPPRETGRDFSAPV